MSWQGNSYLPDLDDFARKSKNFEEFKENLNEKFENSFTYIEYEKELFDRRCNLYEQGLLILSNYSSFENYLHRLFQQAMISDLRFDVEVRHDFKYFEDQIKKVGLEISYVNLAINKFHVSLFDSSTNEYIDFIYNLKFY